MRVAALLPAATDIVIALGAGDQLVAVTHACTLPERLAHLPRVTWTRVDSSGASGIDAEVRELSEAGAPLFELDEALLAAQRPDVILTQAVCDVCAVREEDARAVAARMLPAPTLATLGARTVEGILDDILAVGTALDIDDTEELVLGLRSRIKAVHRKLKTAKAPRRSVIVVEWTDPPFTAGHWVPDMVRRAGGVELIGRPGEVSQRTTLEEVQGRNPELLIVAPCGYSLDAARIEAGNVAKALGRPVWVIDANRLASSPGPGVVHGIEILAGILHPALFGHPGARDAVLLNPEV